LTTQVRAIAEVATAVTTGDLSRSINVEAAGEVAVLKDNINQMIRNLADTTRINTEQDWLKTNVARFTRLLQGQRDLLTVSRLILSELAPLVSIQHGLFFFLEDPKDGEQVLKLQTSYGFQERKHLANRFRAGEGLVGQCMLEKQRILLTQVPEDYVKIGSGLGEGTPRNIVVVPVLFEGELLAVIELATFNEFSPIHLTFLDQLIESIGIVLNTLQANARTEELLKQSQSLTQELQNGQLELQATNQRLEQQARSLQVSEERLREQQEELQQTNTDLEDKAKLLAEQNREVERKNHQIEVARQELEEKAVQLALSSKYKSEFLANMSHELRTPLNSMLVLSQLLAENAEGNLTEKQREYASTIHSSGTDLLTLINEILDLAKIEAGHMDVHVTGVPFTALRDYVERTFREMASEKRLDFSIELDGTLPEEIYTDSQRLQQILRNLLSNAFKFTAHGQVVLRVAVVLEGWSADQEILNRAETVVAFAVSDTGIGISLDRQRLVFEAFQQADGTTSRKFGGTGLGLSISREIATLLRGELRLSSAPAKGSIFTLYLPLNYVPRPERRGATESPSILQRLRNASDALAGGAIPVPPERDPAIGHSSLPEPLAASEEIDDDRGQVQPGDQVLLIVEDDPAFARVLLDRAHLQGFKAIVSTRGAPVPDLARRFQPAAVLLDIGLPDSSGWMLLDRLKHSVDTRHIPVHVISVEDAARRGIRLGAIGWLKKPVTREGLDEALSLTKGFVERTVRNILVVEDDAEESQRIVELIGNSDTQTRAVKTGSEALEAVNSERFDCMVLDLSLKDISAFRLIKDIREAMGMSHLPIIVYTRKPLTRRQAGELKRLASTMVIETVKSLELLLYKSTLLLHRAQGRLPASKQALLEQVLLSDPELSGKRVLIIDDDARNVFALASLLEHHHLEVSYAESGQAGIQMLENAPGIDLVLMDVMMPDMDGFETMRRIRTHARFRSLPIIALTAKAMKGDRNRCLEAGASDYIAKPIDNEQLLSMLRVWASAEEA
ncbi:MAG: response regulator, partial [Methyloceanibacter sp.]